MSIYDNRDKPAYPRTLTADQREYCKNPYILSWWTSKHDTVILYLINEWQWHWCWYVTERLIKITPPEIIMKWTKVDPICQYYDYGNVLMYFALSRAQFLGLNHKIRKPKKKICPLCHQKFIEDSLPGPLVNRLGIDSLDFCAPCLKNIVFQRTGNPTLTRQQVLEYLRALTDALQRIPNQGFGEGKKDLLYLNGKERLAVLELLRNKPTTDRVKELFGSWLKALIEAGVLEDDVRRTGLGIQCIAKDGHVCYSLAEKTIDDYLYLQEIPHEKEPHYPESNFRADFLVNSTFIEYFGLQGNSDYDSKVSLKKKMCAANNISLISIYPEDLVDPKKMKKKIRQMIRKEI